MPARGFHGCRHAGGSGPHLGQAQEYAYRILSLRVTHAKPRAATRDCMASSSPERGAQRSTTLTTMVFIGGTWGNRRRPGHRPYGPRPRHGYRGGSSCTRDLCLVESGCCLAEMVGFSQQLGLLAPVSLVRTARQSWRGVATEPHAGRARAFVLIAIRAYQRDVSPRRGPCCRYSPSCSNYAAGAVQMHGLRHGGRLAISRLLRCRPGACGGSDPVPQKDR